MNDSPSRQKLQRGSTRGKCVYTHSRRGKVFYVGQGTILRAYETRGRPSGWHVECPDRKFEVQIRAKNLSQAQADKLEEDLYLKHCGSARLTNKPIIAPGVNSLEEHNWDDSVLCSKIPGRSIKVPWMMLDSYSSPSDPFRMQFTLNGKTKRFFSKDISRLFHDFCRYVLSPSFVNEFFDPKRKLHLDSFICCYEFWIAKGSRRFLKEYADPTRYRETLEFYIRRSQRLGGTRSEALRQYHADCTSNGATRKTKGLAARNHKEHLAQLKAKYLERFGSGEER